MTKAEYIERYGEEAYKKRLECNRASYSRNKEKCAECCKKYRDANRKRLAEHQKLYRAANKEKVAEYQRAYKESNKERLAEYSKAYYSRNKEKYAELHKEYVKTKNGRAIRLLNNYKRKDKKYNRGECTLTAEWIIENIFSGQVCHWCGESAWEKLGCDRINNDLPHTPENVVCSCEDCNSKRGTKTYDEYRRLLNTKIA